MGSGRTQTRTQRRSAKVKKNRREHKAYLKSLTDMIRKFDDPVLRQKCIEVEDPTSPNIECIRRLKQVLGATQEGVGLAAPQIGILETVIAIKPGGPGSTVYVMINPKIIESSLETNEAEEGCLSYPGVWLNIHRPNWIKVAYYDETGTSKIETFNDFNARVICHSCEHLVGQCFVGDRWRSNKKIPVGDIRLQQIQEAITNDISSKNHENSRT